MRKLRGFYRRLFFPNGPWWFPFRCSSVTLAMGLGATKEQALLMQQALDDARLKSWLGGYR